MTTTGIFKHIDPSSYDTTDLSKTPWGKVDGPGNSYKTTERQRPVENIRAREAQFSIDNSGFAVYKSPAKEKVFTDPAQVTTEYYAEVEELLRQKLPGVKKVVIFDHTIRRRFAGSARGPVQVVHVDQTPRAAEARVRRHVPEEESEELLKGRYQIINVWRPIQYPASDFPLAVIDWRSTEAPDYVKTNLLYPKSYEKVGEVAPDPNCFYSTEGYEVKGEQFNVAPNNKHRFYYLKDMTPDEAMLLKYFDSKSHTMTDGQTSIAHCTPHTAFVDPNTPADAPPRQSIEVRCLVFYED